MEKVKEEGVAEILIPTDGWGFVFKVMAAFDGHGGEGLFVCMCLAWEEDGLF